MGRLALQLALAGLVSLSSAIPAPHTNVHGTRAPTAAKNVIVQMFEWDWDSIAAECTDFLGPNGYGFVQGQSKIPRSLSRKLTLEFFPYSESCPGTHSGHPVVDGLPTGVLHPDLQAGRQDAIREHDNYMPGRRRQHHRG